MLLTREACVTLLILLLLASLHTFLYTSRPLLAERHSEFLSYYARLVANSSDIIRKWLQQLNISINIDEANASMVLGLVYNRSDLALLTGALPLRALKMRVGLEPTVTEDDVAQLLLAVAKGLGVNLSNLSCDKAISKLIINLYYGYVVCPYRVQDLDEFIS